MFIDHKYFHFCYDVDGCLSLNSFEATRVSDGSWHERTAETLPVLFFNGCTSYVASDTWERLEISPSWPTEA